MTRNLARPLAICLLVLSTAALPVLADGAEAEWPQYRGPDRDGISAESGLLDSWPEEGPEEIWRKPIGAGFSGLSIRDGRIFTMLSDGDKEYAAAFDPRTGDEIWRVEIGRKFISQFGHGPRSTPAVGAETAYFLSSYGRLAALATRDGKERWSHDLPKDFGSILPSHGYSTAPMLEGDLLVVDLGGGKGKAYAALDAKSGEMRWSALDGGSNYTSPIAVSVGGERQFVYVRDDGVVGLDAGGELAWSHLWQGGIAMPIFVAPDKIFLSTSRGTMLAKLDPTGDGVAVEELWQNAQMKNHFNSSVLYDGHVYGFDNAILKCVAVETGERCWAKRGLGKGSLILADGKLIILGERGQLVLADATPEGFEEKGRHQALDGKCWTSPTLVDGKLYLRNLDEMVSLEIGG